jgi:hypothetical protein
MTEITRFQALAFDLVDGGLVGGERVDCASPSEPILKGYANRRARL